MNRCDFSLTMPAVTTAAAIACIVALPARPGERAAPGNRRAHFVVMDSWFGQRPPANQPQWHLNLEIRRGARADAYDQFTFSFQDGSKSGIIQTVAGSPTMGSGAERVPPTRRGARFDVEGRSSQGETHRATIDCPVFQKSEGVSG